MWCNLVLSRFKLIVDCVVSSENELLNSAVEDPLGEANELLPREQARDGLLRVEK